MSSCLRWAFLNTKVMKIYFFLLLMPKQVHQGGNFLTVRMFARRRSTVFQTWYPPWSWNKLHINSLSFFPAMWRSYSWSGHLHSGWCRHERFPRSCRTRRKQWLFNGLPNCNGHGGGVHHGNCDTGHDRSLQKEQMYAYYGKHMRRKHVPRSWG